MTTYKALIVGNGGKSFGSPVDAIAYLAKHMYISALDRDALLKSLQDTGKACAQYGFTEGYIEKLS
jgi:hypothetical protein